MEIKNILLPIVNAAKKMLCVDNMYDFACNIYLFRTMIADDVLNNK